jgi:hypothetical protein
MSYTFPWLSTLARRFEKYRFKSVTFHYCPLVPTTATGYVLLAYDGDAGDNFPASRFEAENLGVTARVSPWDATSLSIPANYLNRTLFVRGGDVPSGQDIKTFDCGTLYVFSTSSTYPSGDLYVDYEVELSMPCLEPNILGSVSSSGAAGVDLTHIWGTSYQEPDWTVSGHIPIYGISTTTDVAFKESFEGLMAVQYVGVDLASTATTSSTCAATKIYESPTAAATAMTAFYKIRAEPQQTMRIAVTGTSLTYCKAYFASGSYLDY